MRKHGANASCWWHAPGCESCEDFYARTRSGWKPGDWDALHTNNWAAPLAPSPAVSEDSTPSSSYSWHNRDAASKLAQFYTQEIADLVYGMYKHDFQAFGYPRQMFL
jgi:hypothetical protein